MAEASEELSLPRVKGVKLLCSYAGRILPRPSDGKLRYNGGETRIIVVNRDITYAELMVKMQEVHSQTVALKYQLPDEDLDTLVSICSDEDIEIMIDEYDDREGGSRIRVFLFSSIEHDKDEQITAVAGGIESGFVKRSESAASDGMRDLDDFAGLDLSEGRSHLSSEETVPSPSCAPQLLDGVSLLEQHLQLHAAPSPSQAHSQLISFQSTESPSLASTAPSKQIAVADYSASIFSKEHGGGTSPVQLPLRSPLNEHGLASGFGDLARLDGATFLESKKKLLDVLPCATEDQSAQQRAENQHSALVAEQNLEAYDFKKINLSNLPMTNGHVDAHSFKPSHMTQSSQHTVASIVGCKDTEIQHQKDLLTGPSMNWQTCAALERSLYSHPVNSAHLSKIQSVSLAPLVGRLELQRQDGSEQQNEACQKYDTRKSLLSSSSPMDTYAPPIELISKRQVSANTDNLFSEIAGASDTVTLTQYQDRKDGLASVVPVNVPLHPVQLEAAAALEPQQVAEGRHLSLQDDKENQPVTLGNQQYKAHLLKGHPTSEAKLIMEQNPNLSLQKMKQKNLIDIESQKERNDMRVVMNAGLVQANHLDLELNQKLEAFHQVKATLVKFSDGDVQSESASSIAQCSRVHNEQFDNHPQSSNDLSPEKHSLQPGMLELNRLDAMDTCQILSFSRGPDKVVTLEKLDSSCNDFSGNSGLASKKYSNKPQIDVVREAEAAAEILVGVGATSHLLSHCPGNESHKEENVHTKVTLQEDVQLRNELLNKSRVSSEHILETTATTSHLTPLTTTAILTPEKCLSSSLTNMPAMNTSPLMSISGVATKDDSGHCSKENERIHDTDTITMSDFQETCENSACEHIERREDTKQHIGALLNEHVQEEVVVEVNEVNAEVMIFEDPPMDVKSEDDRSSTFSMTASEAEVEAFTRGLQIIKNADLEERREVGSGTFGTVYYGKWRGSDVAIKRINSSCFSGLPSERERQKADFWKEACILANLHHPNVVAFYGVVPDGPDGTLAMVTEFMINGSIKQVLRKKIDRILDPRRRLFIAMDSAFGLEYLHSKKIVHFDLKCENLFVNVRDPQRPICKVGDFGLSKMKQRTFVSGGVRGTLPWMAPELLNGSSNLVSEKVDVYSFGIVMWELLTGEEPYADLHYGAILGGILNENLRPPVPEGCDPAWRLLMERCWSADPVDRPSFPEIASALRLMAATQLVKVQRPNQLAQEASILQEYVS